MSDFEIYDLELDDYRAVTPSDKFAMSAVENAPDLSLMAKAAVSMVLMAWGLTSYSKEWVGPNIL